jgi:uncharacterized membrane protein
VTTLTSARRFIVLLVVVTAVCAVVAAVSSVGAVDIVFGLPLALFLPGAALVWAIDPWAHQVKGAERAVWPVAASIGIMILGGLLLNLTGGLTRAHWLILSSAVVAVSAVVGWLRAGVEPSPRTSAAEADAPRPLLNYFSLRAVAILAAAVLVVSGALVLSQRTNTESSREHFVQAWILPQPATNAFSTTAQLGVKNEEGEDVVLIIEMKQGSSESSWTVHLGDGQQWTHEITRALGKTVSATVAKASDPSSILARVNLAKLS